MNQGLLYAINKIVAGSREQSLVNGLDEEDAVIVDSILRGLQDPSTLPSSEQTGDATKAAPMIARLINEARRGDHNALSMLGTMAEQMSRAGGDMASLSAVIKDMIDGERSIDNNTFFARVAQRVVHVLSTQTANGRLYEVDTRLRPDGAAGMLVSSLDAFEIYQQEKAWTWEHQALIRARMIVGAAHIAEEFARIRRSVLARPRDEVTLQKDVIEMRQKMRDSLGSKEAGKFHLKQDAGDIVDIEFLVQYAVLANAADHPELLEVTAIRQLLDVLQTSGIFSEEQVTQLTTAYVQYRARSHQRALQEQSSKLDDKEFLQQRENIKQIWQAILGQDLNTQV